VGILPKQWTRFSVVDSCHFGSCKENLSVLPSRRRRDGHEYHSDRIK
jgi:hypothetical protein